MQVLLLLFFQCGPLVAVRPPQDSEDIFKSLPSTWATLGASFHEKEKRSGRAHGEEGSTSFSVRHSAVLQRDHSRLHGAHPPPVTGTALTEIAEDVSGRSGEQLTENAKPKYSKAASASHGLPAPAPPQGRVTADELTTWDEVVSRDSPLDSLDPTDPRSEPHKLGFTRKKSEMQEALWKSEYEMEIDDYVQDAQEVSHIFAFMDNKLMAVFGTTGNRHIILSLLFYLASVFIALGLYTMWFKDRERDREEDFRYGLFDCTGDSRICVCGFCCPAIRWADTVSEEKAGFMGFQSALLFMLGLHLLTFNVYTGLFGWIAIALMGTYHRQAIRDKYDLECDSASTYFEDILIWCCCPCCAVCQEARQVDEFEKIMEALAEELGPEEDVDPDDEEASVPKFSLSKPVKQQEEGGGEEAVEEEAGRQTGFKIPPGSSVGTTF